MRLFKWFISIFVTAIIMSTAGLVSAQAAGAISGTVTDAQTGDPVQGALIEVVGAEPPLTAETAEDGSYQIADVPPGQYSVAASAAGYEGETETGVEVSENEGAVADFALGPIAPEEAQEEAQSEEEDEGKQPGDRKGYVGSFTLGDGVFTVSTKKEQVTIRIPEGGLEAITRVPGPPGDAGGGETDAPVDGAQVAVLVEFLLVEGETDLVLEARQIMVKPNHEPPVAGAVVSIDTDEDGIRTLTIMRPNGTTKEVRLGPEVASPELGDFVTTFPGRGRKGRGREGRMTAKLPRPQAWFWLSKCSSAWKASFKT